jgi:hypothetical protein
MSIDIVKQRLGAACREDIPKVVFLTGGWGEGKTHQWRLALKEAQAQAKPPNFAYVSLFGINSLADARRRLAEEFVAAIRIPGEEGTLGSKVSEITTTARYMQAIKLLPLVPFLGKADTLLNELSFSMVRNAVICIDDIERKGTSLSVADIFGLASFLKEERGCRVVLVANDKKLAGSDATAAQTFLEKVVDEHVHFAPTAQEACDIAMGTNPDLPSAMLRDHLLSLNVANIRVIGRLNRLVGAMAKTVNGVDEKVLKIGVLALAIFGVGHYMPDGEYPTIEFALGQNKVNWLRYAGVQANKGAPPTEEEARQARWDELLNRVGSPSNDPFEVALADAIRRGYLGTNLQQLAVELAGRLGMRELAERYHQVWADFWHSLNGTGDELLDSLAQTTRTALPAIGTGDLRQGYDVFVAAGREAQADAMLAEFIEINRWRPQIFDRSKAAFPEHFTGRFGEQLDAAAALYIVRPTTEEALDRLDVNAYNADDASIVAQTSSDALVQLLKASTGRKFRSRVRVLLALGSMAPNDPTAAATSAHFAATLRAWADADPITAIRLRQYLPPNPIE